MKNLLNLGKALNKAEQKSINGGAGGLCIDECGPNHYPGTCNGLNQMCIQYPCFGDQSNMTYGCTSDDPGTK